MQGALPFGQKEELPPLELEFVRHARARRYRLRVEPDGKVRVTIPRGGSRREAAAFAAANATWLDAHRHAVVSRPRMPDSLEARMRARDELPARAWALAAMHGLSPARVSVRDQRSRWGSCGRNGHICLNWRLVLMPPAVRDYVILHELMHLRQMNHSAAFWRLVAAACPDYRAAQAWLRQHRPW